MEYVKLSKIIIYFAFMIKAMSQDVKKDPVQILHEFTINFPETTEWEYRRGTSWVNEETGEICNLAWLKFCSSKIAIKCKSDALVALSYLRHKDPKIRYIAALAISQYLSSKKVKDDELPNAAFALRIMSEDYDKSVGKICILLSKE